MTNFQVGDTAELAEEFSGYKNGYTSSYYRSDVTVAAGTMVEVRKVNSQQTLIRVNDEYTMWVPNDLLKTPGGPAPRKLGEVPDGAIAPDDPRIMWLWEDAAKVADREGYCAYYDTITDKLGIPGREKNFTVKTEVKGLEVSVTVKARSRKLAEAAVQAALA